MSPEKIHLVLVDDDKDDCYLFEEILQELPVSTQLVTVRDGEKLLQLLEAKTKELPDVIFLDLNMLVKNGMECLSEIKAHEKFKNLCVIIFSTSFRQEVTDQLYSKGAMHYIKKPDNFTQFKELIRQALSIIVGNKSIVTDGNCRQPVAERFVLSSKTANESNSG